MGPGLFIHRHIKVASIHRIYSPYPMTDFVKVFIETERGSDRRYKWNSTTQKLDVVRILPHSYRFPYALGFVPNTKTASGEELPVLCVSERKHKSGVFHFGYIIGILNIQLMDAAEERNIQLRNQKYKDELEEARKKKRGVVVSSPPTEPPVSSSPIHQILIMYPIDDLLDNNLNEVYDLDDATLRQIQWFFTHHWEVQGETGKSFVFSDFSHRHQAVELYQNAIARWKAANQIGHSVS